MSILPERNRGAYKKVFKVKNNFETYVTEEYPSPEYISHYTAYCLSVKKLPLSSIRFEFEEYILFIHNSRVGSY